MKLWKSESVEETFTLGRELGQLLRPGDVVCLYGELGTGKTVLAKGIAAGLGVKEVVVSPTFTILQEYRGHFCFCHVDAYRLRGPEEAQEIGLDDYLESGVTVVEWPEAIASALPGERLDIFLSCLEGDRRLIRVLATGDHYAKLVEEWERNVCARHRYEHPSMQPGHSREGGSDR